MTVRQARRLVRYASDPELDTHCTAQGIAPATVATWLRHEKQDFLLTRLRHMRGNATSPFTITATPPPGSGFRDVMESYAFRVIVTLLGSLFLINAVAVLALVGVATDQVQGATADDWLTASTIMTLVVMGITILVLWLPENLLGISPTADLTGIVLAITGGALAILGLVLLYGDVANKDAVIWFFWVYSPTMAIASLVGAITAINARH